MFPTYQSVLDFENNEIEKVLKGKKERINKIIELENKINKNLEL